MYLFFSEFLEVSRFDVFLFTAVKLREAAPLNDTLLKCWVCSAVLLYEPFGILLVQSGDLCSSKQFLSILSLSPTENLFHLFCSLFPIQEVVVEDLRFFINVRVFYILIFLKFSIAFIKLILILGEGFAFVFQKLNFFIACKHSHGSSFFISVKL